MKVIKPPHGIASARSPKIFLAGSIEMGVAENWQDEIIDAAKDTNITFYNPRRDAWDSSWDQDVANDIFYEQVNWELQALEDAEWIAMYFVPNTKAPITLLELGLCIHKKHKLIVCCPDGFWRKGNVQIICEKYGIHLFHNKKEWMDYVIYPYLDDLPSFKRGTK